MGQADFSIGIEEWSMFKAIRKPKCDQDNGKDFESYFKIGVSDDFILLRRDFPMSEIPPCDFTKLLTEMFRRNEETLRDGK
jgi:hypothetical protein